MWFVKKSGEELRFSADYKKLNAIIIHEHDLRQHMKKTLAELKSGKYFNRIDIRKAFYQIICLYL